MKSREEIEGIATILVDCFITVHRTLGPGLLESTYQACLTHEIRSCGLEVKCEVPMPLRYKGVEIEIGYRIDMLVEDAILIENKAVLEMVPIFEAQVLTYLKLSNHRLGFLVNWNVPLIKDGFRRVVNNL